MASWAVWLWPLETPGSFYFIVLRWRLDFPFKLLQVGIGNCLPGAIAILFASFEGKDKLLGLLSSLIKWRVPLKFYFLAMVFPLGVFWLSLSGVVLYFPTDHTLPSLPSLVQSFVLILPVGPLWEELAWRAYALGKLESIYSQLKSSLILGAYWAIWHVPGWIVMFGLRGSARNFIVLTGFVTLISWSVVFTFLYDRSGRSLPLTILLHATYYSASTVFIRSAPAGQLQFIALSSLLAVCLATTVAVFMGRSGRAATGGRPLER
jgi:membrane protease YdiL (CAAX protease family)